MGAGGGGCGKVIEEGGCGNEVEGSGCVFLCSLKQFSEQLWAC